MPARRRGHSPERPKLARNIPHQRSPSKATQTSRAGDRNRLTFVEARRHHTPHHGAVRVTSPWLKRTPSKRTASNRKPATASKRSSRPKVAARAHRNKQEFVRSPRNEHLRPVAAGDSSESSAELHADQKHETSIIENRAAALHAILLTPQDGFTQKRADRPYRGGRSKDWIKVKKAFCYGFKGSEIELLSCARAST
jgi:hypothetical protein